MRAEGRRKKGEEGGEESAILKEKLQCVFENLSGVLSTEITSKHRRNNDEIDISESESEK